MERGEIDEMLKDNGTKATTTKWALLIVSAPKQNGSLRFRIYYSKLNAANVRDSYPIQHMKECIHSYGTPNVFSAEDADSGYRQIELDEN